jgi:hypothetical protein
VQVVAPAGYTVTGKDLGGNDAHRFSDIDPTTGKTITTTLSAGETDLTLGCRPVPEGFHR